MKKQAKLAFSLAAALCLISQTALAASLTEEALPGASILKQEWVNMELGPGGAVWTEITDSPGSSDASGSSDTPGVPVSAPGEDSSVSDSGQAPSSPVIEAGQDKPELVQKEDGTVQPEENTETAEQSSEPTEDTEKQTKDEAARQAAEEAAKQAEEEAARQAAEEAARRAAEEAERQAAEEAARRAAGRVVDPSRPMVALTFDDGPQPSVGNRIMDCLAQYGGKATFFLVGERVAPYASEVQRMVAEGHEVANHSMNHKYLQKLGAAQIQTQVNSCNDVIEAACGVRPKIMRLPGGNHNATVRANTHMPMIQWNIDTLDWKTKNAQKTIQSVLGSVKDGDVVLMHELYKQTGDAAVQIIPELVNRGYQLVTVSEMAEAKGQPLEAGKLYSSFR